MFSLSEGFFALGNIQTASDDLWRGVFLANLLCAKLRFPLQLDSGWVANINKAVFSCIALLHSFECAVLLFSGLFRKLQTFWKRSLSASVAVYFLTLLTTSFHSTRSVAREWLSSFWGDLHWVICDKQSQFNAFFKDLLMLLFIIWSWNLTNRINGLILCMVCGLYVECWYRFCESQPFNH